MSTSKGLLTGTSCLLIFGLAVVAPPQTGFISGVVRTPDDVAVRHTEVSVDEGGADHTTDSGKFLFALSARLKVGFPATFHVAGWVITDPCVHGRGRTYVPDPKAETIAIKVLPLSDGRLLSAHSIDCVMEGKFSRFEPKSGSTGKAYGWLRSDIPPLSAERRRRPTTGWRTSQHHANGYTSLIVAAYDANPALSLSLPTAQEGSQTNAVVADEFLAKQAKELGFTIAELTEAIDRWVNSVENPYEKGLAALFEQRYAEASRYISESIPSPPGAFVERYVPLARAKYELGLYSDAEADLRKVLAVHTEDPLILNNLRAVSEAEARGSEQPPSIGQEVLGPEHPSVASAEETKAKHNLVVRRDPSKSSPILARVAKNDRLALVEPTADNGYYHVTTEHEVIGWVLASFVNVSQAPVTTPTPPSQPPPSGQCDDTLWRHVYHSNRLIVHQKCISVTGTIEDATNGKESDGVRHEPDGDTHGWLRVDSEFQNLLNAGNLQDEGGNLVFEIICKFPVTQADAKAACSNYQNQVNLPPVGSHVRVVGVYVQDTFHAQWMEIHPVTSIAVTP